MTRYGCGLAFRCLSRSNGRIESSPRIQGGEDGSLLLRPSCFYNVSLNLQRNFKKKNDCGDKENECDNKKKKKDKECDDKKKKDKECDDKKKKKKKPPPPKEEEADPCDVCPKERKSLFPDTMVTAKTGMKMPALILGTWKTDEFSAAQKALKTAFKVGFRAIDTAPFNGNEEVLGCALPIALEENNLEREDIFIISKLPFNAMRCEKVEESLNQSLSQLKTPYVDLYMIHFPAGSIECDGKFKPDPRVDHSCLWKSMEMMVECGKAKYLGVCNFNCDQLEALVEKSKIKPSNVQIEMHAYLQQKSYRKVAKELGCTVTAYAPFGRSPDLVKLLKDNKVKDEKANPIDDPAIVALAKKLCKTPHQVLLRYILQTDTNLAVIVDASDPKLICALYDIFDITLDESDMCVLKGLDQGKEGRLFDKNLFKILFPGVEDHPLFPWEDC